MPALIGEATAAHPDAAAVSCGSETVTYAALERRVAALAALLRERGAGREAVVAVRLERSIDAMAALLAVWRSGAAYLPVDPELPEERTGLLLADSGAVLLVTSATVGAPPPSDVPVLLLDEPPSAEGTPPLEGPPPRTGRRRGRSPGRKAPEARSTSGGRRRVRDLHLGLHRRPQGRGGGAPGPGRPGGLDARGLRAGAGDRVVQFASLSFDAHAEEVYPALASGATLELLPGGAVTLPEVLAGPRGDGVTVLDLPTAYWHRLVDQIDEVAWPARLRLVILGGEQVHASAVARWRERFGDRVRLVNTYGPTEATIIATAADLGPAGTGSARRSGGRSRGPWRSSPTPAATACRPARRESCSSAAPGSPAAT
nr:hypothetical protein GCM10020093_049760 [Planobispora longispora]